MNGSSAWGKISLEVLSTLHFNATGGKSHWQSRAPGQGSAFSFSAVRAFFPTTSSCKHPRTDSPSLGRGRTGSGFPEAARRRPGSPPAIDATKLPKNRNHRRSTVTIVAEPKKGPTFRLVG